MSELEEIERLAAELGEEDAARRVAYREDALVRRMLLKRLRREKRMEGEREEERRREELERREEEERRREARLAAKRLAAKRQAMPDVSCTVQEERYVVPGHSARPSAVFTFCTGVPFGVRGGGELKKPRYGK